MQRQRGGLRHLGLSSTKRSRALQQLETPGSINTCATHDQVCANLCKYNQIFTSIYIQITTFLKNSFLGSCLVRSKYAMRKINSTAIQQHFLQSKASCETVFFYKMGKLDQDGPRLTHGSFSHSMFLVAFLLLSCHLAYINFYV